MKRTFLVVCCLIALVACVPPHQTVTGIIQDIEPIATFSGPDIVKIKFQDGRILVLYTKSLGGLDIRPGKDCDVTFWGSQLSNIKCK